MLKVQRVGHGGRANCMHVGSTLPNLISREKGDPCLVPSSDAGTPSLVERQLPISFRGKQRFEGCCWWLSDKQQRVEF